MLIQFTIVYLFSKSFIRVSASTNSFPSSRVLNLGAVNWIQETLLLLLFAKSMKTTRALEFLLWIFLLPNVQAIGGITRSSSSHPEGRSKQRPPWVTNKWTFPVWWWDGVPSRCHQRREPSSVNIEKLIVVSVVYWKRACWVNQRHKMPAKKNFLVIQTKIFE